jgi:hypothetical protein
MTPITRPSADPPHGALDGDDHRQIERLIHLYAYHLDAGDFESMGALFTHAVVYVGIEEVARRDPAAVAAMWSRFVRIYPNGTPRTHHIATNLLIDPDGPNRARAYSYILVVQDAPGHPLAPITAGDYLDRFEKVDARWRFTERRVGNELFGDMSAHLLEPMEADPRRRPQRWPDVR